MSLDGYFLQTSNSMKKTTKKTSKPSSPSNPDDSGELTEAGANAMDSRLIQALDKITDNLTKVIDTKVATVLEAIKDQTSQLQAVATRVDEAEKRIADVEVVATSSEAKIAFLEKQVRDMREYIDDLDNRGRRCNVRVIGLPENAEGPDPVKFLEKWIPEYLQMTTKDGRLKLDRAHRSLAPKPGPNQRPRPLILRFHNFRDKQRAMEAARRLGSREDHTPREPKVSFFNDYSAEVVRRRKAFDDAKIRLKKMNVDYALLYPATLRVTVDGKQKRVDSPEDAELLVQSLEQRRKGTE